MARPVPPAPYRVATLASACALALSGTGCPGDEADDDSAAPLAHSLFVGLDGSAVSFDIATGEARPGAVQDVTTPVDMQALADGTVLVNLTDRGEVLAIDGRTLLEVARVPSSGQGATRPVHGYLSPERGGRQYWFALNDGEDTPETNSARLIDVVPGSATYLQAVGEVGLGVGHHKAAFSATRDRVVISNISDCDDVLTVFDYSDPADVNRVATLTAEAAGWDGSSYERTCDPTYATGLPPAPHGCATSTVSGKAYCNLTASGEVVVVDVDADPPTFAILATGGSGAGYVAASRDGRFVFTVGDEPREGSAWNPGVPCQVGQLAAIAATRDVVDRVVPLLYDGPECARSLLGTDEETAGPGHILVTHNDNTLFIGLAGGWGVADARVRRHLMVDVSDPSAPVQLPSIEVGASTSHHGDALSGDGKWVFVANNVDGTVTQIHSGSGEVQATLSTGGAPAVVATFGDQEGPGHQSGPLE